MKLIISGTVLDFRSAELDESICSETAGDVSVRQRCGGSWRFSSSRPRLTVSEFCRRRQETKKRQRSSSITNDDNVSVNDSITSAAKRRRTALKVSGFYSPSIEIGRNFPLLSGSSSPRSGLLSPIKDVDWNKNKWEVKNRGEVM